VRVTNVEQNRSAATVVNSTFAQGVSPQSGDVLVPAVDPAKAGEATEADLGLGPDVNAAGPGDSIILPPVPGAAADPGDPFGAMQDDAPPVPAPADDPFGAMDSMDTPAPSPDATPPAPAPAGDDPFGALKPASGSPDPFAN